MPWEYLDTTAIQMSGYVDTLFVYFTRNQLHSSLLLECRMEHKSILTHWRGLKQIALQLEYDKLICTKPDILAGTIKGLFIVLKHLALII